MSAASGSSGRTLVLCFHNHQPVGNFDSVLEEATHKSYRPFLQTLSRYPGVKATLHYTGYLLDWLIRNAPDVVDLLRAMAASGQVELLGGGMYEPILTLLPERDRQGQLQALASRLEGTFGKRPDGIWLAERVWEPGLVPTLAAAGVKYLPLDDYHFLRAGLSPEELDGVWLTESDGATLKVFPGSEALRYLIPFGSVDESLAAVDRMTSRDVPCPAAIFADDGEKFGVWPGTHHSVYEEGWLSRFFEGIEARRQDGLATMTFGEYVDQAPVRGRIYLPTCSYVEMGEWALPPKQASRFDELLRSFREGNHPELKPFAQGGTFRNFLRKYEESNLLHKRMWGVSARVEAACAGAGEAAAAAMRNDLYCSQSNDVYWHGVFGGIYLNHLREAAWTHLLRAESAADRLLSGEGGWTQAVRGDLDADDGAELLLKTPELTLLFHSHDGGSITEISLPRRGIALGHVLTRREEAYHARFRQAGGHFDGSTSIHDVLVLKDPSVLDALETDPCQRASLRETFFGEGVTPAEILAGAAPLCTTAGCEAGIAVAEHDGTILVSQDVPMCCDQASLTVEKSVEAAAGAERFIVRYRLVNHGKSRSAGTFATEWNLNFLSGGYDRWIAGGGDGDVSLSGREVAPESNGFRIFDVWRKISVGAQSDRPFTLVRYPVETASLSEAGAEKIHQGVCLRLLFPIHLHPGESAQFSVTWDVASFIQGGG
ncbi:MAG TPA: alpha-amylase/4-alpha-glucanotransferase domain-containing protein [Candidatus Deferrimicrobiaceae bacterium]|jgi:alpha-amylase